MNAACELYRHYDDADNLLYVGISVSTPIRLAQHKQGSAWFGDIAKITIEHFQCRADALRAERAAIECENPKHNKSGKPSNALAWLHELIATGPMSRDEVVRSRAALGLTQQQLAERLELTGDNGKRTVRHWETDGGKFAITGPARVAIRLLLAANTEMRKPPFAACDQLKTLGDE